MKEQINHLAGSTFLVCLMFLAGGVLVSVIGWKLTMAIGVVAFIVFLGTAIGEDYE